MHSKTTEMNSHGSFCLWVIITCNLNQFFKILFNDDKCRHYHQWTPLDGFTSNSSEVSELVPTIASFKYLDPQLDLLLDCAAANAQLTFRQIGTGVYLAGFMYWQDQMLAAGGSESF